tara:strand:- start:21 stop:530 length:510 start_codon:yes stop_codon:yes gene_type:complete
MFRSKRGEVTILFAMLAFAMMYMATTLEYGNANPGSGTTVVDQAPVKFIGVNYIDPEAGYFSGGSEEKVVLISLRNNGGIHEGLSLVFIHSPRTEVLSGDLEKESDDINGTVFEQFPLPVLYGSEKEVSYTPFTLNRTNNVSVIIQKEELTVRLIDDEDAVYDERTLEI